MKKIIFRIIMVILALILILSGIILYSEKVHTLAFVENIKKALGEQNGTRAAYTVTNATRVDVTDLEDSESIGHEHFFKTMYDENKHWEECTICHTRNSEGAHSYIDNGWQYGNSCKEGNVHKYSCNCGYGYTTAVGKPSHRMTSTHWAEGGGKLVNMCQNSGCGYAVVVHNCCLSNGSKITCNNMGTCALCGYYYAKYNMAHIGRTGSSPNGTVIKCGTCNIELARANYLRIIKNSNTEYIFEGSINFTNGNYYSSLVEADLISGNHTISKISTSSSSTSFIFSRKINYNDYVERGGRLEMQLSGSRSSQVTTIMASGEIGLLDDIAPIITSITMEESEELTEWSRTKPIIVAGTENYCRSVTVTIVDENGDIVFNGRGSVNNPTDSNYSVSCIPEVEVDTNGKTFKAIVVDSCGNTVEKEFTIAKIDAIPPTATSGNDITGEWSKSRKFTFAATDYGIGEVSIAFNDIADLNLANFDGSEYTRDYEFYGDVYTPKQLSVLYRDGLGNISIQKVIIDKLDNTAPTINKASIHNNVVSIEANDRHERLGEGSGIVKYRYVASSEKLNNPDVSNGIEVTDDKFIVDDVYKAKYIYIVAEDAVGNVSGVYELKVPDLILTSSVYLSLANGKGGVILDWSTYDVSDKYFVVYRKEENATDWETIVSLDKKLTGSTYTDILGNDKSNPDVPNITITGDAPNNNIKIEATSNDNGTKYSYYIEAYDDNGTLLKTSI